MRHLYKNLKKHFKSKKLKSKLWQATQTYSIGQFQKHTLEMEATSPAVMTYLRKEHNKFWSKSQFGTIAKCDYITNNIAETFNSWISDSREKLVLDLLIASARTRKKEKDMYDKLIASARRNIVFY
jgi:hypothetical protein